MRELLNHMTERAEAAARWSLSSSHGIVTSYNPSTYSVKVNLMPDEIETGWIPMLSIQVGDGWGVYSPPSIGDLVHVFFAEGEMEAGVAFGAYYNNQDKPLPVEAGEFWVVNKSGSFVKLQNSGDVLWKVANDLTVEVTGNVTATVGGTLTADVSGDTTITTPKLTVNGDVEVNGTIKSTGNINSDANIEAAGDLSDESGASGTVAALRTAYNNHEHPVAGVQGGNSTVTSGTTTDPVGSGGGGSSGGGGGGGGSSSGGVSTQDIATLSLL